MGKATIVKLFRGSLLGMAASAVLFLVAGAFALGSDVFVKNGPDVVGVRSDTFGWTMLTLAAIALLGFIAAVAVQFVAWIGAVLNTAQLPDKTWFIVLLVLGVLGFGVLATLAYITAGPDGEQPREPQQPAADPVRDREPQDSLR